MWKLNNILFFLMWVKVKSHRKLENTNDELKLKCNVSEPMGGSEGCAQREI